MTTEVVCKTPERDNLTLPRVPVSSHSRPEADLTEGGPKAEAHGAASNDVEGSSEHAACVTHRHQLHVAGNISVCAAPPSAGCVIEMHAACIKI